MQKLIGVILLVVGIILLVWGYNNSQAFASQFSEAVTGSWTDETMWLLIGGAVGVVAGLILMLMPRSLGRRK